MVKLRPSQKILIVLLTSIAFLFGVIVAKDFLYPLAFAVLFSYLLFPVVNSLEKYGFPRVLAIISALLLSIAIIAFIAMLFYRQLSNMLSQFGSLKQTALANIETMQHSLETSLGLQNDRLEVFLKQHISRFFTAGEGGLGRVFSATTGAVFGIFILPIYVFLFLYYRTKFAYFILKIVKKKHKPVTIKILRDISTVAARYMGGVTIVVLILCVINSAGLMIIGVKYALLLGIISAVINYIPYFGTLMGGSIPLVFVLLTTTDPINYAIKVVILFVIIQFTENNILTPNIVGGNVKINPFFIIIGLVAGSMIWGIPGMLVIVPFLAITRIICNNIPGLKPYAFLLGPGGTQQHSITMSKLRSFFDFRKSKHKS